MSLPVGRATGFELEKISFPCRCTIKNEKKIKINFPYGLSVHGKKK